MKTQIARVKNYLAENERLLKRNKLIAKIVINFPKSKKAPLFGRIGIWFLRKSGAILDTEFRDLI